MKKKISVSLAVAIALIAMTVTFSVTMILAMRVFNRTVSDVGEKQLMYDKLARIDQVARDSFYAEINDETLFDMIATGYVAGLGDRNSHYYTARQYAELTGVQSGRLMGIGVEIVKDASGYFRVVKVYEGSPAAAAGLVQNVMLTQLDGVDLRSLSLDTVNGMLRGESGTTLQLAYLLDNVENQAELQRSPFEQPTVEFQLLDTVGYIKLRTFTSATVAQLDYAINSLRSQGAQALVFDLRNNTGGSLDAAAECIDLLCPAGVIAQGVYKDGEAKTLYTSDGKSVELPMVALTNSGTAAGAELFALSLREFELGRLVGETTAGRGSLQQVTTLTDGSAVELTVAVLLTGSGTSFDGAGVEPDYERVMTAEESQLFYDFTVNDDPQIQRAVEVAISLAAGNSGNGPANVFVPEDSSAPGQGAGAGSSSQPGEGWGTASSSAPAGSSSDAAASSSPESAAGSEAGSSSVPVSSSEAE